MRMYVSLLHRKYSEFANKALDIKGVYMWPMTDAAAYVCACVCACVCMCVCVYVYMCVSGRWFYHTSKQISPFQVTFVHLEYKCVCTYICIKLVAMCVYIYINIHT